MPSSIPPNYSQGDFSLSGSDDSPFRLHRREEVWPKYYHFLLARGYKLRKRYLPDWKCSWLEKGLEPVEVLAMGAKRYMDFEDSIPIKVETVDATRTPDGVTVVLKHIPPPSRKETSPDIITKHSGQELEIMQYINSPELLDEPENPCPPLLDSFELGDPEDGMILVMPLLRDWRIPSFRLVHEAVIFIN